MPRPPRYRRDTAQACASYPSTMLRMVPLPIFDGEDYPPPIPSVTLPVPSQTGQGIPSCSPRPLQCGQMFSPVPGVPGAASSPGAVGSLLIPDQPGGEVPVPFPELAARDGVCGVMKLILAGAAALALAAAPASAQEAFGGLTVQDVDTPLNKGGFEGGLAVQAEIGRASCRERV